MSPRAVEALRSLAALTSVSLLMAAFVLYQRLPSQPWSSPLDASLVGLVGLLGVVFLLGALLTRPRRAPPAAALLRAVEAHLPGSRRRWRDGAVLLDARRDGAFVRVTARPGDLTLSCRVAHRVPASLVGRVGRIDDDLLFVPPGETTLRAPPAAYQRADATAALDRLRWLAPSVRVGQADLEAHYVGENPDQVVATLDQLIALARALAPPVEVRVHAATDPRLTCPYCHGALDEAERLDCAGCGTPHHAECFHEHGRCTALGCEGERPTRSRVR